MSIPSQTQDVLGREREYELLVAALDAGAHVVLEGPPGTGKSTLLRPAWSGTSTRRR